jgi:O-succinylhomoserine sulfhydrylase
MSTSTEKKYRPETRLVHAGTLRSQFGETSEAMFLTQGYVYDTAAQAEARFKGEDPGYQYSRFANPTIDMFERRMAAFEGAEAARATATGMAAVTISLVGQLKAGDHVVGSKAMFGSCRYVIEDYLPRFGVTSTLVNGCNLDDRARRRRDAGGRQCLCHTAVSVAARTRRRLRCLFGDQTY